MKYLIIGAGGVGGALAGFLAKNNIDPDVIARGKYLEKLKKEGLDIKSKTHGDFKVKINAFSSDEYNKAPDVIFICTKCYCIDEIIPLLKRISNKNTIIIPLMNGFCVDEKISQKLPYLNILQGCIYIASYKNENNEIIHTSDHCRVFFGLSKQNEETFDNAFRDSIDKKLKQIESDLNSSLITAKYSKNIMGDIFTKFSLISPFASCGIYLDVNIGEMQKEGTKAREVFINLLNDLNNIKKALNIKTDCDIIKQNLQALKDYPPSTVSSCYRDFKNNHKSEIETLIFDVVKLAQKLNIKVSQYEEIADFLKESK